MIGVPLRSAGDHNKDACTGIVRGFDLVVPNRDTPGGPIFEIGCASIARNPADPSAFGTLIRPK